MNSPGDAVIDVEMVPVELVSPNTQASTSTSTSTSTSSLPHKLYSRSQGISEGRNLSQAGAQLRKPSGVALLTVEAEEAQGNYRSVNGGDMKPARWKTPEFIFYALVFVLVVPLMVWGPVRLSDRQYACYLGVVCL